MTDQPNYITEDTTIKGTITTSSSLTVAGAVEGDINAGGELVILDDAHVRGDVSGPSVRVQGKVEGRVVASGRLVIAKSGSVLGNIAVRSLLIEEGGTLQGECSMGAAATPTAASTAASNGRGSHIPAPPLRAPTDR
jgi:cytoskeletal protein CcmA (bactofilin family)